VASFALAAIGKDRPGIVAAVASVLFEEGCNVEDSSMSLLRGNFAVMLVFSAPDGASVDALTSALKPACDPLAITFSVLEVDDTARTPNPTHSITVYGSDEPGILDAVARVVAAAGGNITNLDSRLVGADQPIYVLTIEAELADGASLERDLRAAVDVDVTVSSYDADVL
jgi:glycine cleavage system transcriptional repressor